MNSRNVSFSFWAQLASLALFTMVLISCTLDSAIEYSYAEGQDLLNVSNLSQIYTPDSDITVRWKVQVQKTASQNVAIEQSLDDGTTWQPVAEVLASLKSFTWKVPAANIPHFKVRAHYTGYLGSAITLLTSENIVIDNEPPVVNLLSLLGGEVLRGGSSANITWSAQDLTLTDQPITLSYSSDAGATWNVIASNIANSGAYSWTVPSINSNDVLIKAGAKDAVGLSSESQSTSRLSIDSDSPQLSLTYPLGGESILGDSTVSIQWTANDAHFEPKPIKVEVSSDGGITWNIVASSTANSGSFTWTANIADTLFAKIRITATDSLGQSTQVSSGNFTISRALPKLTLNQATQVFSNTNTYTYSGACDLSASMPSTDVTIVGPSVNTTVSCTGSAPTGTWTYTTAAFNTDGTRSYSFSQTNNLPLTITLYSDWYRDTVPPTLSSVTINDGESYAKTQFANVTVTAQDNRAFPLKVRLIEFSGATSDCTYSAGSWNEQPQATVIHPFTLSLSGVTAKKICAWAEDRAGNQSTMAASTGTPNVDSDTINFEIGNPPEITSLKVYNPTDNSTIFKTGDTIKIEWTTEDTEGLDNKPISIDYTLDGTNWIPLVSSYGNLSGNPTSYTGSYASFAAPSAGFIQIRIKAKDMAGNYSYRVISNSLNSGAWSIFAGNLDNGIGNTARGVTLINSESKPGVFAIHPRTGDMYILSDGYGILKVDVRTGLVSQLAGYKSQAISSATDTPDWTIFNIPENGEALPTNFSVLTYLTGMNFDNKGRLYLNFANAASAALIGKQSTRIYQLDLDRMTGRWYAGGGNSTSNGVTPRDLATEMAPIAFDEDNSLYAFVLCDPQGSNNARHKLVKITQTTDGLADQVIHIAGNCAAGTPGSGAVATNTPFNNYNYTNYSSLVVWDHGNKIYYNGFSGLLYKIINGIHYPTAVNTAATRGLAYNPVKNVLYVANGLPADGSIQTWSISTSGAGGETLQSTVASAAGAGGDCLDDGILASNACVVASHPLKVTPEGRLIFTDGFLTLSPRPFRLRYVDDSSKIQTIAGTLPFYGKDKDKSLMRANSLGSIFTKTTTEPGSIYTPGVYFVESAGQVFGRFRANNTVEILWGNQRRFTGYHTAGTQTSDQTPIGAAYDVDGRVMAFDPNGLPWVRYNRRLISLTSTGTLVERQTASTSWETGAAGSNPSSIGMSVNGLSTNLFFKGTGVFLMGTYRSPTNINTDAPVLRFFDFGNSIIKHIMGGVGGSTPAPDNLTATDLTSQNLSSLCVNSYCSLQFFENDSATANDDLLYINEGRTLRVITNPLTPGAQTIQTLFTETAPHKDDAVSAYSTGITNFFVTQDRSKVFYLFNEKLYCRTLTGTSSWCNGQSLGPDAAFGTIVKRPNQFTMKDSTTLLLNNGRIILEFKFPTP